MDIVDLNVFMTLDIFIKEFLQGADTEVVVGGLVNSSTWYVVGG